MYYLVIDTCVWGDLFDKEFTLVPKLADLIKRGKVTIVLPDLIVIEWDGIKNKLLSQLNKRISELSEASDKLRSFVEEGGGVDVDEKKLISSGLAKKISAQRIALLEEIIKSDSTILLPISASSESLAVKYALEKKAPFKARNGMADALIFFTAVEWANRKPDENNCFVSSNVTDFSNKEGGDKNSLSPDLAQLIEKNRLRFAPVLARLLSEIESSLITEEEIRDGDLIVETVRIKDEMFNAIYRYDLDVMEEILKQHKISDEFIPKGALAEILAQQKIADEFIPKGALAEMLEQQKIADEFAPKGVLAEILEQQKIADEFIPKGALAEILAQQKIADEFIPKGVLAEILEQQKIADEFIPKGALAEILEQQKKLDDLLK